MRARQTRAVEPLLSWLEQREDQMAALLADLIAIPTENPPGRHYREFVEVLEKQTEKLGLEFTRLEPPGLLDTRFYAARGVPGYAYGPGLLSVAHGPNEYVGLRRVVECASIYALTAMKVFNRSA